MMNKTLGIGLLPLALIGATVYGAPKTMTPNATPHSVTVYTTAKDSDQRLSQGETLQFAPVAQPKEPEPFIFVDPNHSFQTFVGIGGALTDSSAETFAKLPESAQQEFLDAYFSTDKGIGYSFARTNMASCDFSSGQYDYVEPNDKELKTFSIAHDKEYKIPFIKAAMERTGGKLPLFVSPWSPSAWMKTNNSRLHGGSLLPEYYDTWANYFVKYIKALESEGVPVWGLTAQNEPMATQIWDSCIYTAEQERDFIRDHLGPTLKKNGLGDKKLIAWDHNRDLVYQRAATILNDPKAAKYVWGIGFHWYEPWTGGDMQFQNVKQVHESFPDVNLVFTEGCVEKFEMSRINDWTLGERYGHSMINDFNSGTVAWTDWNILLDERGGPNHVGNFCFAPIHGDTQNGKLLYTNEYYYIGHFSKFIRPGAKRIALSSNRQDLQATAFQNKDGSIAVVVMNRSEKPYDFKLIMGNQGVPFNSLPHSISTYIIK